jgi:hypothetical protein
VRIIKILNKIHYLKSFVFVKDQLKIVNGTEAFVVDVVPRRNGKPYVFRTENALRIALFHTMGDLPEPELTHRFC